MQNASRAYPSDPPSVEQIHGNGCGPTVGGETGGRGDRRATREDMG